MPIKTQSIALDTSMERTDIILEMNLSLVRQWNVAYTARTNRNPVTS